MIEKLSNEHLSYIIGLFQGDGSLYEQSHNRGQLTYEISEKDAAHIDKLKNLLDPIVSSKVRRRIQNTNFIKNYRSIRLTIFDFTFRDDIKKYIPVGKKSEKICPPEDDFLEASAYLRGLYDADGSIGHTSKGEPFISICVSSENIKTYILNAISDTTGITKRLNRNKRDNVYNICLKNESAQIFSEYLYKGSTLHLDRKFNKYKDISKWCRPKDVKKRFSRRWSSAEDKVAMSEDFTMDEKVDLLNRSKSSIKARQWRLNT